MRLARAMPVLAVLFTGEAAVASSVSPPAQRTLTVDDLLRLEGLGAWWGGAVALSAEGRGLAVTRVRPRLGQPTPLPLDTFLGNDHADIWLSRDTDRALVPLTDGARDHTGWWAPSWSPDGRHLAVLSTRGGEEPNVWLWVWDGAAARLERVSRHPVSLDSTRDRRPYEWLDAHRLIVQDLNPDERNQAFEWERRPGKFAAQEWAKQAAGVESTASLIDPRKAPSYFSYLSSLSVIDLRDRGRSALLRAPIASWRVSGSRRWAAVFEDVTPGAATATGAAERYRLRVIDLTPGGTRELAIDDVFPWQLEWSLDERRMAVIAAVDGHPTLIDLDLRSGARSARPLPPIHAAMSLLDGNLPVLRAIGGGRWIVRGAHDGDPLGVMKWWIVDSEIEAPLEEIQQEEGSPAELYRSAGGRVLFGQCGDHVLALDSATAAGAAQRWRKMREERGVLVWPSRAHPAAQSVAPDALHEYAIVRSQADSRLWRIDPLLGRAQRLAKPAPGAELLAYGPGSTAIFSAESNAGLRLWRSDLEGRARLLLTANDFLRDVRLGEVCSIEYRDAHGSRRHALYTLPARIARQQKYPLIVSVYPGLLFTPESAQRRFIGAGILNPQIAAAAGYIVLQPSMPLGDELLASLGDGVHPAIDALARLGVVDERRIYLMGHSFGGFAVYGLLAQTQRFQAAIAVAGPSNWLSMYGQFNPKLRYLETPDANGASPSIIELGQGNMKAPPHADPGRYLRNSPMLHTERIHTPLLIVHNDLDYVPVQQAEELFALLRRQGKRVAFLRYWGEAHDIESAANMRDFWSRALRWFASDGASAEPALPEEVGCKASGRDSRRHCPPTRP